MMREAEEDRTSKHKLTGHGEHSRKPHWQLWCYLAPILLGRLRAWDQRGKGGDTRKVRPMSSGGTDCSRRQFRVANSDPCSKTPLPPLIQREPAETSHSRLKWGQACIPARSPLCLQSALNVGTTAPV